MTDEELQQLVESLSQTKFHKSFQHLAYFNRALRTTGGRYMLESHHIEMNPKLLDVADFATFKKIIIHELCHYHLHLEGKGYKHCNKDFKQLLAKTGGLRYSPEIIPRTYFYRCTSCGTLYERYRPMNLDKYCCGRCYEELEVIDKETYLKLKQ